MALILPETDMRLAPTLGPVMRSVGGRFEKAIKALQQRGVNVLQLDGTLAGLRPRELDRRARRELQAILRRQSMALAGMDLFIPRDHFADSQHVDRAIAAVTAGLELAADLGKIPVSLALPVETIDETVVDALVQAADSFSVPLAVHHEDDVEVLMKWLTATDCQYFGAGLDPAAILGSDQSPAKLAARLGSQLRVGRVSDLDTATGKASAVRCVLGQGALDLANYRAVLDLASKRVGPVVLDLRGLENPGQAVSLAHQAWQKATPAFG